MYARNVELLFIRSHNDRKNQCPRFSY